MEVNDRKSTAAPDPFPLAAEEDSDWLAGWDGTPAPLATGTTGPAAAAPPPDRTVPADRGPVTLFDAPAADALRTLAEGDVLATGWLGPPEGPARPGGPGADAAGEEEAEGPALPPVSEDLELPPLEALSTPDIEEGSPAEWAALIPDRTSGSSAGDRRAG
jgi:hypothetical protein